MVNMLFIFFCMAFAISSALPESDSAGFTSSDILAYQPDNGTIFTGNLSSSSVRFFTFNPSSVEFFLYRLENPQNPQKLSTSDVKGLKNSGFDPNSPTKIIIHGLLSGYEEQFPQMVKNAYLLGAKKDCNIILVNIKDPLSKDYPQLVWHSAAIGGCVKSLILLLIKHCGLNVSDLHIIGHSMGAQIGGLAGDGLAADGFLIHRLTGLDPAGPIIGLYPPSKRLDSQDAQCVDVWHTSWILGIKYPAGNADYYPNGGNDQPLCDPASLLAQLTGSCSHSTAYIYFSYTILNPFAFPTKKCSSYEQALLNNCAGPSNAYMSAWWCNNGIFSVPREYLNI